MHESLEPSPFDWISYPQILKKSNPKLTSFLKCFQKCFFNNPSVGAFMQPCFYAKLVKEKEGIKIWDPGIKQWSQAKDYKWALLDRQPKSSYSFFMFYFILHFFQLSCVFVNPLFLLTMDSLILIYELAGRWWRNKKKESTLNKHMVETWS